MLDIRRIARIVLRLIERFCYHGFDRTLSREAMEYQPTLVFDIGLHKGEDTNFYLKKGYKVIAFEASPDLVEFCKNRFKNEIAERRLHIVEGAITSELGPGPIRFYRNEKTTVFGTIRPDWNRRNEAAGCGGTAIEVSRVNITACLEKFGIPQFMKIDIEGADTTVLNALTGFHECPAYLSIESNKVDLDEVQKELDVLSGLGYVRFMAVQQAEVPKKRLTTTDIYGKEFTFVFEKHASGPFGEDLGQLWLSAEACMADYRKIFKRYRTFGDESVFRKVPGGLRFRRSLEMVWGHPLPGWYDTHAALPPKAR
jgi:FkbM family methyltransferase